MVKNGNAHCYFILAKKFTSAKKYKVSVTTWYHVKYTCV